MSIFLYDIIQKENTFAPELYPIKKFDEPWYNDRFDEEETVEFLNDNIKLKDFDTEHIFVVGYRLDCITGIYQLGIGTKDSVDYEQRNVGIFLLLSGATSFKAFHNHPDGWSIDSMADKLSTLDLISLGKLLDIQHTGSYVVSREGWLKVGEHLINTYKIRR